MSSGPKSRLLGCVSSNRGECKGPSCSCTSLSPRRTPRRAARGVCQCGGHDRRALLERGAVSGRVVTQLARGLENLLPTCLFPAFVSPRRTAGVPGDLGPSTPHAPRVGPLRWVEEGPGGIISCVRGSGLAVMAKGPGILAGFGRGMPHYPLQKCGRSAVSPSSPSDNLSWPGFAHGAGRVWATAVEKVGEAAGFPWSSPDICAGCQTRSRFSGSPCNPFGQKEPIAHGPRSSRLGRNASFTVTS